VTVSAMHFTAKSAQRGDCGQSGVLLFADPLTQRCPVVVRLGRYHAARLNCASARARCRCLVLR
jgi:hypothetical protein